MVRAQAGDLKRLRSGQEEEPIREGSEGGEKQMTEKKGRRRSSGLFIF
jgi:hypothetical protein